AVGVSRSVRRVTDMTNRRGGRPSRSGGEWIYARRYLGLVLTGGTELHKERGPGGTRRVERDPGGTRRVERDPGGTRPVQRVPRGRCPYMGLGRARAECAAGR